MVRAGKLPYDNFEYNMRRALALARLDGYLEDISSNEGKRTIGVFLDIRKELTQTLGIDDLMGKIEKTMEAAIESKLKLNQTRPFTPSIVSEKRRFVRSKKALCHEWKRGT